MKLELDETFINKLIPKIIKIPNVNNLSLEIEEGFIKLMGKYMIVPFSFKLIPINTSGSKIQFSIEGLFNAFLPKISQKGIKLENNILEINLQEFVEDLEVKKITFQKHKVYVEF